MTSVNFKKSAKHSLNITTVFETYGTAETHPSSFFSAYYIACFKRDKIKCFDRKNMTINSKHFSQF